MGRSPEESARSLDFRQLRLLHLLLTRRSVSRVAEELGVSQPSVSLTLNRLRRVLNDRLLVRGRNAMVPTERGLEIAPIVERLLIDFDRLTSEEGFDPALSTRSVRIASPNYLGSSVIPDLAARLSDEAPGMSLEALTVAPGMDYGRALSDGLVDLVIGNWPDPPPHLRAAPLLEDEMVCLMARDHPERDRGPLTIERYLALDHISPTPLTDARFSPVDAQLSRLKLSRRIRAIVPEYLVIPIVLQRTRLVFTTGARFAEAVGAVGVAMTAAPREFEPIRFQLLWHERSQDDPAHRWLRRALRALISGDAA